MGRPKKVTNDVSHTPAKLFFVDGYYIRAKTSASAVTAYYALILKPVSPILVGMDEFMLLDPDDIIDAEMVLEAKRSKLKSISAIRVRSRHLAELNGKEFVYAKILRNRQGEHGRDSVPGARGADLKPDGIPPIYGLEE